MSFLGNISALSRVEGGRDALRPLAREFVLEIHSCAIAVHVIQKVLVLCITIDKIPLQIVTSVCLRVIV